MNKTLVYLTDIESGALLSYLPIYFSEISATENKLISEKFELINEILFARIGIKKSIFGVKLVAPYKLDNEEDLRLKLAVKESELRNIVNQNKAFNSLLNKLYVDINFNHVEEYIDNIAIKDAKAWKLLENEYKKIGVEKSIDELKKIVKE